MRPHRPAPNVAAPAVTVAAASVAARKAVVLVAAVKGAVGVVLAVVVEEALRHCDLTGLAAWIEAQPSWSDFPFVVLTQRGGSVERNPAARRLSVTLGNVSFLERPFHPTTLVSAFSEGNILQTLFVAILFGIAMAIVGDAAAPVQRAILSGDNVTGVTIMDMEAGLDTGPMRAKHVTPVEDKTAGELTQELAQAGAELMVDVLDDLAGHPPVVQPEEGVTYAAKIEKAEARIDFSRDAHQVERQVRAFNPFPGAFFEYGGERFRILAATVEDHAGPAGELLDHSLLIGCSQGAIRPTLIQRAGKAAMSAGELLRGFDMPTGSRVDA